MKKNLSTGGIAIMSLLGLSSFTAINMTTSNYYVNAGRVMSPTKDQFTFFSTTAPGAAHCFSNSMIICYVSSIVGPDPGETTLPTGATISSSTFGLWH